MKRMMAGVMAVAALGLSGCGTDYQAKGPHGGYTDTQLGPSLWRVEISANSYTRSDLIREFALLRSAELAVRHGYTHFAMSDPKPGTGTRRFVEPSADNLVTMFAGRPQVDGPVFDAQRICATLGNIYNVECRPGQ